MLFGFPLNATEENWLHDCLGIILERIHAALDSGATLPEWPELVPTEHRDKLKSRRGLRVRVERYAAAAGALTDGERRETLTCLSEQNSIADLVSCTTHCEPLTRIPSGIRQEVLELFSFGFDLLTDLGIRRRHYIIIYDSIDQHVCPFCGLEYFDAPTAPREDLDHYLARSIYPLAAVNLNNLVPMGKKCNQLYKGVVDILRSQDGKRRKAFNPYGSQAVSLRLDKSTPFSGQNGQNHDWQIEFDPMSEECLTWDSVFRIRERVVRDVLHAYYDNWLTTFRSWYYRSGLNLPPSSADIENALRAFSELCSCMPSSGPEWWVEPMFQTLHRWSASGDLRFLDHIRTLLTLKK